MDRYVIKRHGSYLYARAWLKIVAGLTLVYTALAALLAVISEIKVHSLTTGLLILAFALGPVAALWFVYLIALRIFKWESRRTIELVEEGIRELRDGRELKFMTWAGVKEVEVDVTGGAGATLRVKGPLTEIVISNIDLVITQPMGIRRMHRAMGRMGEVRGLLTKLESAAVNAELKMNEAARRRLREYDRAVGDVRSGKGAGN